MRRSIGVFLMCAICGLYQATAQDIPNLDISRELVLGFESISRFGCNPDVDIASGFETIWEKGGKYAVSVNARLMNVKSSTLEDAGTLVSSGTTTPVLIGDGSNQIVDNQADFVSDGVLVGDLVINDTNATFGYVTSIESVIRLQVERMIRPRDGETSVDNKVGDSYRVVRDSSTGVSVVVISGLDENFSRQSEFVLMNGTNDVLTALLYMRIENMRAFSTAAESVVGFIEATTQIEELVLCRIENDNNQSLMSLYTVPSGFTGYLSGWSASLADNTPVLATFRLRVGNFSGISYTTQQKSISKDSGGFDVRFSPPVRLPQKIDVWVNGSSDSNNSTLASGFTLILISNELND